MLWDYFWVLFFLAAGILHISGRSNRLLTLGVGLLGLTGFMIFLAFPFDLIEFLAPLANIGGILLIVVGVVAGQRSFTGLKAAGYLGGSPAEQSSLVIPRNQTNSFTRALALRDDLYRRILTTCEREGIAVVGYKSRPEHAEVWLHLDYILPKGDENLSLRSNLTIYVERFDYHRFEHLLKIELRLGNRTRTIGNVIQVDDTDIQVINRYLTNRDHPVLSLHRTRTAGYQIWRPKNKVERLRTDWAVTAFLTGITLSIFIPTVGILMAIGLGVAFWWFLRRRRVYILTTGRPLHDPRGLIRMDSWQANVYSLGGRQSEVREAVLESLQSATESSMRVTTEHIWYPGPDGKVEREQITLTFRRATAFVHLEAYGDDLYVGWDSHVNAGTWLEEVLSRGVDRRSGKPVVANRVVSGWSAPNEYDITDVSFLTEWLHNALTRVVKLKMEEHKIDQEIDFTVQRESRRDITERRKREGKPRQRGGLSFLRELRRVG